MSGCLPTLESERLLLRPFAASDAACVTELLDDPTVSATLAAIPYPYLREYADAWIATHDELFATQRELHLAIVLRASDELLGAIALLAKDPASPREIGYWLGRRYWRQGLATEAVRTLLQLCRLGLGLSAVRARCMIDNPASAAVLLKAGFRAVGPGEPITKGGRRHATEAYTLELCGDADERAT